MRIDLVGKGSQARFRQSDALRLELFLGTETAPDSDRKRNREQGSHGTGNKDSHAWISYVLEEEECTVNWESFEYGPAQHFRDDHDRIAGNIEGSQLDYPALNGFTI